MLDSGDNEIRVKDKRHYLVFKNIFEYLEINGRTRIRKIVDDLSSKEFTQELIKNAVLYFILEGYLKIVEESLGFQNGFVEVVKKPHIIFEGEKKNEFPKIVLSFPPFNKYGLIEKLKTDNLEYSEFKKSIYDLFSKAETHIYICSPFLEYDGIKNFLPVLITKARMGVKIKIISREIKSSYKKYHDILKICRAFKDEHIKINIRDYHYFNMEFGHTYMVSSTHAKLVVIDNKYAYVGSGELRKNSFEKNFELGIITNGDLAHRIGTIFEIMYNASKDIPGMCDDV